MEIAPFRVLGYNFMIVIDNKLISDEVLEEQFVCDLHSCKGGCCEDGDAGAPLEDWEKAEVDNALEIVKPYLTPKGLKAIKNQGNYTYDNEFGWVTPTINNALCAYGFKDKTGVIQCSFEKAYNEGKIGWKKPLSCHLFPIRVSKSTLDPDMEYINYEPRQDLCAAACTFGQKLKIPVYVFLKEPIIRKYGEEFYEVLAACANRE
ncbi:DUF3109 family protein [Parasediminibacterium sp. JCM 36343]|uniref:DUF3109 family protein n=1 Tax=Parasediminibacterium sp. JCM 36343 TaxID=3374279 RepID=UPI00397DC820